MSGSRSSLFAWCAALAAALAFAAPAGARAKPHDDVWRLTGRLAGEGGRPFDYSVTFFRYANPRGPVLYPAAVSIVDESSERRYQARRIERDGFGLAGASAAGLSLHSLSESASRRGVAGFEVRVRFPGGLLHIDGVAAKPRIAIGPNEADDYAYTSIESRGWVALGGERLAVTGKSWLEHETGDDAAIAAGERIARYRVQLDDGREILIATEGSAAAGEERIDAYLVRKDGTREDLEPGRYEFGNDGGTAWRSPHSDARYPALWALHVDGQTEFLSLEPVAIDQESTAGGTGAPFWDGAVDVYDVTPGSRGLRLGSGSVLLAGYAAQDAAR